MSVIEKVKDLFVDEEKIVWQCDECDEEFETFVKETEPTPDSATCEHCGSTSTSVRRRAG
ncbi:hypothetical protein [Halospeciosus flavus]|uniref:Uncharacterized protein n=1 Tax=Halospeciosus flavus TaxID=3032283 RepID=A0ABD5Z409_9EURY|nr:hypothetical protein [Halospeciosus flavus]